MHPALGVLRCTLQWRRVFLRVMSHGGARYGTQTMEVGDVPPPPCIVPGHAGRCPAPHGNGQQVAPPHSHGRPNLTFPLQLHCDNGARKYFIGAFGALDVGQGAPSPRKRCQGGAE